MKAWLWGSHSHRAVRVTFQVIFTEAPISTQREDQKGSRESYPYGDGWDRGKEVTLECAQTQFLDLYKGTKIRITATFLSETTQTRTEQSDNFKVLKWKKLCQLRIPFPLKIFFKSKEKKYFLGWTKIGRIKCQHTCSANVKKSFRQNKYFKGQKLESKERNEQYQKWNNRRRYSYFFALKDN